MSYYDTAMNNVNRFLGDTGVDAEDLDSLAEEVYTLAHDGAVAAGACTDEARRIAQQISQQFVG